MNNMEGKFDGSKNLDSLTRIRDNSEKSKENLSFFKERLERIRKDIRKKRIDRDILITKERKEGGDSSKEFLRLQGEIDALKEQKELLEKRIEELVIQAYKDLEEGFKGLSS